MKYKANGLTEQLLVKDATCRSFHQYSPTAVCSGKRAKLLMKI